MTPSERLRRRERVQSQCLVRRCTASRWESKRRSRSLDTPGAFSIAPLGARCCSPGTGGRLACCSHSALAPRRLRQPGCQRRRGGDLAAGRPLLRASRRRPSEVGGETGRPPGVCLELRTEAPTGARRLGAVTVWTR